VPGSKDRSSPYGTPKALRSPMASPLISDPKAMAALDLNPGTTRVVRCCFVALPYSSLHDTTISGRQVCRMSIAWTWQPLCSPLCTTLVRAARCLPQDAETRKSFEDFKAQEAAKKKQQTCVPLCIWAVMFAHGIRHAQDSHRTQLLSRQGEEPFYRTISMLGPTSLLWVTMSDGTAPSKPCQELGMSASAERIAWHMQAVREAAGAAGVQRGRQRRGCQPVLHVRHVRSRQGRQGRRRRHNAACRAQRHGCDPDRHGDAPRVHS